MALTITIAADIENQLPSEKQLDMDSISYDSTLSDSGHGSTLQLSSSLRSSGTFAFPGELLTDDEFAQEFSSSCSSSRRCSTDPHVTITPLPPSDEPNTITLIPAPPPPPPLPPSLLLSDLTIRIEPPPRVRFQRSISLDDSFRGSFPNLHGNGEDWNTCMNCFMPIHDWTTAQVYQCCSVAICSDCIVDRLIANPALSFPIPCPNCGHREPSEDLVKAECIVCFEEVSKGHSERSCCSQVVCRQCIQEIIRTNIEDEGKTHIPCPNPECKKGVIGREEIIRLISGDTKEKFERYRLRDSGDSGKKTCPNCCLVTEHKLPKRIWRFRPEDVHITCSACQFDWCFRCHAPWHQNASCREFQQGEKHFKKWTKSKNAKGTANCQKCPLCRVYIQRSTGCDHMTCNRCETEFCYKCGGLYNGLPLLGDHHDRLSIFGCKYNYKQDRPAQRKTLRGGYLGAKLAMLMGYPVLFVAGLAVVVVVGVVALPAYGGYKYYKYKKRTRRLYRPRQRRLFPQN